MSGPTLDDIYVSTLPGYFRDLSPDVIQSLRETYFVVVPQSENPGLFYVTFNFDALQRLIEDSLDDD